MVFELEAMGLLWAGAGRRRGEALGGSTPTLVPLRWPNHSEGRNAGDADRRDRFRAMTLKITSLPQDFTRGRLSNEVSSLGASHATVGF
jgi:hypothetical protein